MNILVIQVDGNYDPHMIGKFKKMLNHWSVHIWKDFKKTFFRVCHNRFHYWFYTQVKNDEIWLISPMSKKRVYWIVDIYIIVINSSKPFVIHDYSCWIFNFKFDFQGPLPHTTFSHQYCDKKILHYFDIF